MPNFNVPFTQFLFNKPLDAMLRQLPDEVVPGVSCVRKYEDIVSGEVYTGIYCNHINHLLLRDSRTPAVSLYPMNGVRFTEWPDQKIIIWDVRRNGTSSILRTRAALDGVEFGEGEPSKCHDKDNYRWERLPRQYSAEKYKDWRHIAFVQDGEERFIKLINYWVNTGPANWYMYTWLPHYKTQLKKSDLLGKVEWMLACAYINSFSNLRQIEPHELPQYRYLQALRRVDEVWHLRDMDKFFKEEMGIECKRANCETKEPQVKREDLPDEWNKLITHIYKQDSEIKLGSWKKDDEEEEEYDALAPKPLAIRDVSEPRAKAVEKQPELFSMWIGDTLPEIAQMSIKSFLSYGFKYKLFTYKDRMKDIHLVPDGCEVYEANDVLGNEYAFLKEGAWQSYAMFSDLWRYTYLMQHDGCWMDLDYICLKPWRPQHWFYSADGTLATIDNNPLQPPKKHPLIQDMVNVWLHPNEPDALPKWAAEKFPDYYKGDASKPLTEQLKEKHYGWGGSSWLAAGIQHYGLEDKVGEIPACRHFPRRQIARVTHGDVKVDDPLLQECQAIHLFGSLSRYTVHPEAKKKTDSLMYYLWSLYINDGRGN